MKTAPVQLYKDFGTYQLIQDEDDRYYECRHIYSGQTCTADNLKEVKSCLDDLDDTHQEIQAAIRKLKIYGYQVVKVID
jgi:hypothetical protein